MVRSKCRNYAIGTSSTTVYPLSWYGVPDPINTYLPWAVVVQTGNKASKGYGFPTDQWQWSVIGQGALYALQSLLGGPTVQSVEVFIDTYVDTTSELTIARFQCQMHRPLQGNGKNLVPQSLDVWADVVVKFTGLVEV